RKEYLRKYREKNRAKIREQQRSWELRNIDSERVRKKEWSKMNPEKVDAARKKYYKKQDPDYEFNRKLRYKYDLSRDDYDKIIRRQNNKCPIMQTEFTKEGPTRPHVDHSHETGRVRSILSNNANTSLGLMKENPEAFYRAAAYLTLNPNKPLIYIMGSLRNEG